LRGRMALLQAAAMKLLSVIHSHLRLFKRPDMGFGRTHYKDGSYEQDYWN
jgi:hypothetical protein